MGLDVLATPVDRETDRKPCPEAPQALIIPVAHGNGPATRADPLTGIFESVSLGIHDRPGMLKPGARVVKLAAGDRQLARERH